MGGKSVVGPTFSFPPPLAQEVGCSCGEGWTPMAAWQAGWEVAIQGEPLKGVAVWEATGDMKWR